MPIKLVKAGTVTTTPPVKKAKLTPSQIRDKWLKEKKQKDAAIDRLRKKLRSR